MSFGPSANVGAVVNDRYGLNSRNRILTVISLGEGLHTKGSLTDVGNRIICVW
jgi:hypothetical protein